MTVDFATYCCHKDVNKLKDSFKEHIESHKYPFNKVHIIFQRIKIVPIGKELNWNINYVHISKDSYDEILDDYDIRTENKEAEKYTHGWKII